MAKIQSTDTTKRWQGGGATGLPVTAGGSPTGAGGEQTYFHPAIQPLCSLAFARISQKLTLTQELHVSVYDSFIHNLPKAGSNQDAL